ncbi:MAG: hypothetical protein CML02_13380 [Pseudooceanicola sp.]|jgi:hypothetical protein|nr:hypothetical protein [Pseudooceanicola sp.]
MRLLALLLLILPGLAAAQSWTPINQTGSPLALRGASYCYAGKFSGTQCVVIGCTPQRALGLYLVSPSLAINGMRDAQLSVDQRVYGAVNFVLHEGAQDMFVHDFSRDTVDNLLTPLRSGRSFSLDFQEGSNAFSIAGVLAGSSSAIAYAESACPAPVQRPVTNPEAQALAMLVESCSHSGGLTPLSSPLSRPVDLDGVPPMDLQLDFGEARCNEYGSALHCGSAGCRKDLFQAVPGGYRLVFSENIYGIETGPGGVVTMSAHGSFCNRVGAAGCTITFRFINGEFTLIDKR